MDPEGLDRNLPVSLDSDVPGYSRLMQDNEAATVNTLEAYKQIISEFIKQHRSRVVGSPGDSLVTPSIPLVALRTGLIDEIVTKDKLMQHSIALAKRIA